MRAASAILYTLNILLLYSIYVYINTYIYIYAYVAFVYMRYAVVLPDVVNNDHPTRQSRDWNVGKNNDRESGTGNTKLKLRMRQ